MWNANSQNHSGQCQIQTDPASLKIPEGNCSILSHRQIWGNYWSEDSPSHPHWLHQCNGFSPKQQGHCTQSSWGISQQPSQGEAQADQSKCFLFHLRSSLECFQGHSERTRSDHPPIAQQNLPFDHMHFPGELSGAYGVEGEKEGPEREQANLRDNSLWNALYSTLLMPPISFSFYNQNSVKPCGTIIKFIDQDFSSAKHRIWN